MTKARFKVLFSGPLVTFQDAGRQGHLRHGVSHSGPMDIQSFDTAFAQLGSEETGVAIEVSLGGLGLECLDGETTLSVAGGDFIVMCNSTQLQSGTCFTVQPGDKITIRAGVSGSWCYLAFSGDVLAQEWLGSVSTHSMSGFGGGALQDGLTFEVDQAHKNEARVGTYNKAQLDLAKHAIRIVIGPQDHHFDPSAVEVLCTNIFELTDAFDRMGVRLSGPKLTLANALSIPSEPIIRGSVQVSGDGIPTVLLSDHQTTGGYPKIATVISADMDRLSQLRAGDSVKFQPISANEAVFVARDHATKLQKSLEQIRQPRASLDEKLYNSNLISGVIAARKD